MSTLVQVRTIVEWSEKGWTPVRFPNADNIETATVGGPAFLANPSGKMVMVDNDGLVYHVDPCALRQSTPIPLEDVRPAKPAQMSTF